MHFLNPAALIALAAAAVPLAVHLLHRGSSEPLPFSNLSFLRRLHQSRMRSIRLRQWLVLLLRTLAVAALVLAFARPALRGGESGWFGRPAPVAAAILLDASYSTGYRPGSVRVFERLRSRAIGLLELFSPGDEVRVIPFASDAVPVDGELPQALRELAVRQEGTHVEEALRAAEHHFEDKGMQRELFIFSDFAAPGWLEVAARRSAEWSRTAVYTADLELSGRANRFVSAVEAGSWLAAPGGRWRIRAEVVNASESILEQFSADLFIDGERVQRRAVELQPGGRAELEFATTPRRDGFLSGYVEIEEDALTLDDRRYFTAFIPRHVRVVMAGDPGDLYFAQQALAAAAVGDPSLELDSISLSSLGPGALDEAEVLILCNVSRIGGGQIGAVRDFAARGGGVVLFPGADADISYLNRHLLSNLIPASIRSAVGRPEPPQGRRRASFLRIDPEASDEVLLRGLTEAATGPRFFSVFSLIANPGASPLLSFGDGSPAALIAGGRAGRVVLFAVPLSLEWSELPSTALFAPLLQRLCRLLGTPSQGAPDYLVGETVRRRLPGTGPGHRIEVRTPSGRRYHQSAEATSEGTFWTGRPGEAGVWRLEEGGAVIDRFAVNVDTGESDLEEVSPRQLERVFGPGRVVPLAADADLREQVLVRRYGRELWREFLLAALALLLAESWIARAPRSGSEGAGAEPVQPSSRSASKV